MTTIGFHQRRLICVLQISVSTTHVIWKIASCHFILQSQVMLRLYWDVIQIVVSLFVLTMGKNDLTLMVDSVNYCLQIHFIKEAKWHGKSGKKDRSGERCEQIRELIKKLVWKKFNELWQLPSFPIDMEIMGFDVPRDCCEGNDSISICVNIEGDMKSILDQGAQCWLIGRFCETKWWAQKKRTFADSTDGALQIDSGEL